MGDLELTLQLAQALGVDADAALLNGLFGQFPPLVMEWSVNGQDDPRASLRLVLNSEDGAAVERALGALGQARCAEIRGHLPNEGLEAIGYALGAGPPRFRYYNAARPAAGTALCQAAVQQLPELALSCEILRRECGSLASCAGLGLDVSADGGGARVRSTLYFYISGPHTLTALRRRVGDVAQQGAAARFFDGILRRDEAQGFPKLGVGRSEGQHAGWKFYYFARGDFARRDDQALLALAGVDDRLARAHRLVAESFPGRPVVQLLGLTFADAGGPPRFSVYLASR